MNSAAATETPKKVVGLRRKVITPVVVPEPVKKVGLVRKKVVVDPPVKSTCCTTCDKEYDPKCTESEYERGKFNPFCSDCWCDECSYQTEDCTCDKSSTHTDDPEVCAFCLAELTEDDERFYCDHREQWFCEGCNKDKKPCDAKSCDACHPEDDGEEAGQCADCEVEIYKHEIGTTALKDGLKLYCEDCTH